MTSQTHGRLSTRALGDADFAVPIESRYFEHYVAGHAYEYGHVVVTEQEIVEFAERFDPQPIHTDAALAASGPFAGLIASGWHSAGIFMRLFADHYLSRVAILGSPGVDRLRWPAPLRPGDCLRLRTTIAEARPSRSRPDRGVIHTDSELVSDDERIVLRLRVVNILLRRDQRATP